MTEQTLAARLATIMGEVGPIEKKGRITSKGDGPTYKFARDPDVLAAVTPRMAAQGIIMVPESQALISMTENMRGTQIIANIKTGWHVTDGKESIRFETFGQGQDSGDKALPKAQSNARKYAFFMLYHIVTGDDPDHYASEDQPERGRAPQREAQPPSRSAPAPVRTPEEQALIGQLLELPSMTVARMTLLADAVGIPKGTQATADQLRAMLVRAEQPDGEPKSPDRTDGGDGSSDLPAADTPSEGVGTSSTATPAEADSPLPQSVAPNDLMDDILAVTGGIEQRDGSNITLRMSPPSKPGTAEYKGYTAQQKVEARAYWQLNPEPEEVRA